MKENFPDLVKEIDFKEVQEVESKKEIGNLFEQIMKENFSILAKE